MKLRKEEMLLKKITKTVMILPIHLHGMKIATMIYDFKSHNEINL